MNDKIYVGSAVDIEYRWSKHIYSLNKNVHHNSHLQNAWNKYGEDKFVFEILESTEPKKNMILEREQHWIDEKMSFDRQVGYNIYRDARSPLGTKRSKEFRQKMSKIAKKRVMSEETKKRLSFLNTGGKNAFYGKKHTKESRSRMGVRGENHFRAKLDWQKVDKIREEYSQGVKSIKELSEEFNVHNSQISRIINNKIWRRKDA